MHRFSIGHVRRLAFMRGRCAALLLALAITGCGGQRGPKVEYVEGLVTLDGKPLDGASVGYSPVTPGKGLPAGGKTDADSILKDAGNIIEQRLTQLLKEHNGETGVLNAGYRVFIP